MRVINKKIGETPIEALKNFRIKYRGLKNEKMSYAGRLDPLAEGKMIVLVGDKENKDRNRYMDLGKEYSAEFMIGVSTLKIKNIDLKIIKKNILNKIDIVSGDFRQDEITEKWKYFFKHSEQKIFQTYSFKIKVSGGTFIRGLAEEFEKSLRVPVALYSLKRTRIFT